MSYEYSVDALVAAHTAFRDLVDAEAGTASVTIHDGDGVELVSIPLADPSGTVDAGTGQLSFDDDGNGPYSADETGDASTAKLRDGDGAVKLTLSCIQGTQAVSGYCVLNSLSIEQGVDLGFVALTIG